MKKNCLYKTHIAMIIKLKIQFVITLSMTFGLLISPVLADGVSGKAISFSCNGCHGTDGRLSKPGILRLNTQTAEQLEKKLLNFKYDRKIYTIMGRIAKGYTDQELKAVALYFSQLK